MESYGILTFVWERAFFFGKSSTNGYIKVFRMGFSAEIMLSGGKGG